MSDAIWGRLAAIIYLGAVWNVASRPLAASAETSAVEGAEAKVLDEIRRLYGEAVVSYDRKEFGKAELGFQECVGLFQASEKHLSNPAQLETIRKGCERYLQLTTAARKRDAALNGLEGQLARLELASLHFREVEAGVALEMLRKRIGTLLETEPPVFVIQMPAEAMNRTLTLEVERIPALYALQKIAEGAGAEIRFERYAAVFLPLHTVQDAAQPAELSGVAAADAAKSGPPLTLEEPPPKGRRSGKAAEEAKDEEPRRPGRRQRQQL